MCMAKQKVTICIAWFKNVIHAIHVYDGTRGTHTTRTKKNKKKIIKAKPINMNLDAPMQRFCLPDFVKLVAVAADQKRPSIKI